MRLRISGNAGKQEILEAVAQLLNTLEDAGADEFKSVSLYLTPMKDGNTVKPTVNGEEANILHKSTQKHQHSTVDENGTTLITRIAGLTSKDIDINRRYSPDSIEIKLNKINKTGAKKQSERKQPLKQYAADKERRHIEQEEKRKANRELKSKQKAIEFNCIKKLKEFLQISSDQYIAGKSSSGWLKTRKGIEQYTDSIDASNVFRITMKRGKGEQGKVYLFDEGANIIFESVG